MYVLWSSLQIDTDFSIQFPRISPPWSRGATLDPHWPESLSHQCSTMLTQELHQPYIAAIQLIKCYGKIMKPLLNAVFLMYHCITVSRNCQAMLNVTMCFLISSVMTHLPFSATKSQDSAIHWPSMSASKTSNEEISKTPDLVSCKSNSCQDTTRRTHLYKHLI